MLANFGATACTNCEAGKLFGLPEQTSHVCTTCAAGKYSGWTAQTSPAACFDCGAGTYSLAGAALCTNCEAGKYKATAGVALYTKL